MQIEFAICDADCDVFALPARQGPFFVHKTGAVLAEPWLTVTRCGVEIMRSTIVLSGDCRDAKKAAKWAEGEVRRADFSEDAAATLADRVQSSYKAACKAFFAKDGATQMLMLCLDLSGLVPRFELISDGEQARGTFAAARGLRSGQRRRNDLLDGLTCVSIPA